MMRNKILIIEDEEVLLDVLKVKLLKEGYQVETAKNGEEGWQKIKQQKPDLILLDIVMPKMDGYEVLKKMHDNKFLKNIPVIIISNSGQPVEIDKALELGAVDYLIKAQFSPDEVLTKVNQALNKRGANDNNHDNAQQKNYNQMTPLPSNNIPQPKKGKQKEQKNIAVIEDDQFLRELVVRKLAHEGFNIITAIDGQEGYNLIIKQKPDLVLLDIMLPVQDGFDVLARIREHPDKIIAKLPVILLSNLGQNTDITKGKKLGANDYLVKASLTTDQIVNKIKKYI